MDNSRILASRRTLIFKTQLITSAAGWFGTALFLLLGMIKGAQETALIRFLESVQFFLCLPSMLILGATGFDKLLEPHNRKGEFILILIIASINGIVFLILGRILGLLLSQKTTRHSSSL